MRMHTAGGYSDATDYRTCPVLGTKLCMREPVTELPRHTRPTFAANSTGRCYCGEGNTAARVPPPARP